MPLALEGNELLALSTTYCRENLTRGNEMAVGHVRSLGFSSIREEDIEIIKLIDPTAVEARKTAVRRRGKYFSMGLHHVWHMDGWHKFIMFGFVVHSIID